MVNRIVLVQAEKRPVQFSDTFPICGKSLLEVAFFSLYLAKKQKLHIAKLLKPTFKGL